MSMKNTPPGFSNVTNGAHVSLVAPPKLVALKLPPLQAVEKKSVKGGEFLSAKASPMSKSTLAEFAQASEKIHLAEAKTSATVSAKSPSNDTEILEEKADTLIRAKPKGPTKKDFLAKVQSRKLATVPVPRVPMESPNTNSYKQYTPSAPPMPVASANSIVAPASIHDAVQTSTPNKSIEEQRNQNWLRAKAAIENFAESPFFVSLMAVLTVWALYNNDIKFAATDKEADLAFEVIISIAFFLFILEIGMSCVYKPDYWWLPDWKPLEDEEWLQTWIRRSQVGSFYFWLDWLSTLSLLLEVCIVFLAIVATHI